jgi:hypothetical protein
MLKESVKRALRKQRYHVVRISDEERAIIDDFERSLLSPGL